MSSVEKLDVAVNLRRGEAFRAWGSREAEWFKNGLRKGEGRTLCDFRGVGLPFETWGVRKRKGWRGVRGREG